MLHELPRDLAARVECNHIWMDTYGGDQSSDKEDSHKEEDGEEAKVCEPVVVLQEDTIGPYGDKNYNKNYPPSTKWDDQDPDGVPQEPPVDSTYCRFCLCMLCMFLQWQDELERLVR
jgi:hypothetical protein